jgi:hypothetical protein
MTQQLVYKHNGAPVKVGDEVAILQFKTTDDDGNPLEFEDMQEIETNYTGKVLAIDFVMQPACKYYRLGGRVENLPTRLEPRVKIEHSLKGVGEYLPRVIGAVLQECSQ